MKYAADIVFIPPKPLIELIVKLNNEDFKNGTVPVKLGMNDYVPHLSLVMGVLDRKNEQEVIAAISAIVANAHIQLSPTGLQDRWIGIEATEELQNFHTFLMEQTYHYFEHGGIEEMYYRTEPTDVIDPTILTWINEFDSKYSKGNFKPHITAWTDTRVSKEKMGGSFFAPSLALYHLGNYNTCRRLIHSWKLT